MKAPLHLLPFLICLGVSQTAGATTVTFEATDLVSGEDRWQYNYTVSDFLFDEGYGISIFFDWTRVAGLESPPPSVGSQWDILVLQPDANLPSDGIYDALATSDSAPLSQTFSVVFIWTADEPPRHQTFLVYEPGFQTIEVGTTAELPEPSALGLTLIALAFLLKLRTPGRGTYHAE